MARAFLLSLLSQKRLELGDSFVQQFAHPWLVWDADSWSAPSLDGATRVIGIAAPKPHVAARESLCYALTFPPAKTSLRIGRSGDQDVVINDGTVSRAHAVLHRDPQQRWMLQVVTANARTLHQDRLLSKGNEVTLTDGDRVEFGDVRLRFLASITLHVLLGRQAAVAGRQA